MFETTEILNNKHQETFAFDIKESRSYDNAHSFEKDTRFLFHVSDAITAFLAEKSRQNTAESIEERLNEFDASLYNISDLDRFTDALLIIFRDGVSAVADSIINAAYCALGFEGDRNYTLPDMRSALERLQELSQN